MARESLLSQAVQGVGRIASPEGPVSYWRFVSSQAPRDDEPPAEAGITEIEIEAAEMPKDLFEANYTSQGFQGLLKEGGTSRRVTSRQVV